MENYEVVEAVRELTEQVKELNKTIDHLVTVFAWVNFDKLPEDLQEYYQLKG